MNNHEKLYTDFLRALSRLQAMADAGDLEAWGLIRTWKGLTKVYEQENFDNDVVFAILNYAGSDHKLGDKYKRLLQGPDE